MVAVMLGTAGCATPAGDVDPAAAPPSGEAVGLTEDAFAFGAFLTLDIPSFDGVTIHVDVQLPEGEGPFPLLLEYTPYSNTLNPTDELWAITHALRPPDLPEPLPDEPVENALAAYYVPKGYAVGVAHVRGSGQSGGCFSTGGPDEAKDGYAIVEALANESWSNGRVAMMGTSYVGTTPIATATLAPPHLTTIVPVSAVSEWYRYYFENGEPRLFGELPFGVVYTDHPLWAATGFMPKPRNPTGYDPSNVQCGAAQMQNAWAQDDYNDHWTARNSVKDLGNATAPMLYAHGFRDENTPTSLVTDFYDAYPGVKRLWMQQHGHGVPGAFESYHSAVHRWLDFWMLDRPNGALDMPAVILQDDREKYHMEADWPPKNATWALYHLGAGTLQTDVPEDGSAAYVDAIPCRTPRLAGLGTSAAPCAEDDPRSGAAGHVVFTSEPLARDLHVSGAPRVELLASSDKADTQFDVTLMELPAEGDPVFVTRGYLDARHAGDLARGQDLVPGEEQLFVITMHGRDHHVEAGSRLALYVTSHDEYVLPDAPGATNTIRLGADGSRLLLPVLENATFHDQAPVPWR